MNDMMEESNADENALQDAAKNGGGSLADKVVKGMQLHAAAKCQMRGRVAMKVDIFKKRNCIEYLVQIYT